MGIGMREVMAAPAARSGLAHGAGRARAFFLLTRPSVTMLVVFTVPPAVLFGGPARSSAHALLTAMTGTLLLSAGCSAVNAWHERALDARMARTRRRPLPAGAVRPGEALGFGLALCGAGIVTLAVWGGLLAALLGLLTFAWYVGIYTIWLKPRSAHSTVVGAVAGAAAPLIADAAAHGSIGPWGWTLFLIVFLWQPPHVWSIALFRKADYAAAGLPMLPAVAGDVVTRRWMFVWALVLLPVSLLPWFRGALGLVHATTALVAGIGFLVAIAQSMRARDAGADRRVFAASVLYLLLVFGGLLAELALR